MAGSGMDVRWMFHATAMVRDYEAAVAPLTRLFGARVLHDTIEEDPAIGRRGGMMWLGDGSIEVGEPAGPDSPVTRFLRVWPVVIIVLLRWVAMTPRTIGQSA